MLKSPDPFATAQFYVDTLGATKIADVGENGVRLDLHGLTLNVTKHIESQTREQKYGMEHIAIDADDIQGMIDMLKANGATILEEAVPCPATAASSSSRARTACSWSSSRGSRGTPRP